jgi:hypothetical protein
MQLCGEKVILVVLPDAFRALLHAFSSRVVQFAAGGRPLDAIARHDFRARDKSVCDGKTRRALLWLSVPFERGNHTRSNGGAHGAAHDGRG